MLTKNPFCEHKMLNPETWIQRKPILASSLNRCLDKSSSASPPHHYYQNYSKDIQRLWARHCTQLIPLSHHNPNFMLHMGKWETETLTTLFKPTPLEPAFEPRWSHSRVHDLIILTLYCLWINCIKEHYKTAEVLITNFGEVMLDLQHKGNFVELNIRDQWSH